MGSWNSDLKQETCTRSLRKIVEGSHRVITLQETLNAASQIGGHQEGQLNEKLNLINSVVD